MQGTETQVAAPPSLPPPESQPPKPPETPQAPQPPKKVLIHFKKVLFSSPIFISGKPVPFEPVAGNEGVIQLDEAHELVAPLSRYANERRGGIVSINAEEYEEAKKKEPLPGFGRKSPPQKLKVFNPHLPLSRKAKEQSRDQNRVNQAVPPAASAADRKVFNGASGGGAVGVGGGSGPDAAGQPASEPTPQPAFKPATARQSEMKMPVTKKTNSRSLSGGVPVKEGDEE